MQKGAIVNSTTDTFKGYERGETEPGLVALYDVRPGNGAGLLLQRGVHQYNYHHHDHVFHGYRKGASSQTNATRRHAYVGLRTHRTLSSTITALHDGHQQLPAILSLSRLIHTSTRLR